MVEEDSKQSRSDPGLINLQSWGFRAGRLFLPSERDHWTYSFALSICLNTVDSAITWISLSLGAYEAGPFLRFAANTYGDDHMIAVKMLLALLLGILVWRKGSHRLKGILNLGMATIGIVNCVFLCRMLWMHNYS